MLKLISFLLFTTLTFAQPELLILMDGVSYEAETLAYQARVEADGGSVISLDDVNAFYVDAKANDYLDTLSCAFLFTGGVKLSGTDVLVWYDLSTNDLDLPYLSIEPTYTEDGLQWGAMRLETTLTLAQPVSFYSIFTRNAATTLTYLWGDAGNIILYTDGSNNLILNAGSEITLTNSLALNTPRLYTFICNGASSSSQYNDNSPTTGNIGAQGINEQLVLNPSGSEYYIFKAFIITPMLSTAKSTALKAILNTLYSVY